MQSAISLPNPLGQHLKELMSSLKTLEDTVAKIKQKAEADYERYIEYSIEFKKKNPLAEKYYVNSSGPECKEYLIKLKQTNPQAAVELETYLKFPNPNVIAYEKHFLEVKETIKTFKNKFKDLITVTVADIRQQIDWGKFKTLNINQLNLILELLLKVAQLYAGEWGELATEVVTNYLNLEKKERDETHKIKMQNSHIYKYQELLDSPEGFHDLKRAQKLIVFAQDCIQIIGPLTIEKNEYRKKTYDLKLRLHTKELYEQIESCCYNLQNLELFYENSTLQVHDRNPLPIPRSKPSRASQPDRGDAKSELDKSIVESDSKKTSQGPLESEKLNWLRIKVINYYTDVEIKKLAKKQKIKPENLTLAERSEARVRALTTLDRTSKKSHIRLLNSIRKCLSSSCSDDEFISMENEIKKLEQRQFTSVTYKKLLAGLERELKQKEDFLEAKSGQFSPKATELVLTREEIANLKHYIDDIKKKLWSPQDEEKLEINKKWLESGRKLRSKLMVGVQMIPESIMKFWDMKELLEIMVKFEQEQIFTDLYQDIEGIRDSKIRRESEKYIKRLQVGLDDESEEEKYSKPKHPVQPMDLDEKAGGSESKEIVDINDVEMQAVEAKQVEEIIFDFANVMSFQSSVAKVSKQSKEDKLIAEHDEFKQFVIDILLNKEEKVLATLKHRDKKRYVNAISKDCISSDELKSIKKTYGYGLSPLGFAALNPKCKEEIWEKLIEGGADINFVVNNAYNPLNGSSILMIACYFGHFNLVKKLLENDKINKTLVNSPNSKNYINFKGWTCFEFAVASGNVGLVNYLLKNHLIPLANNKGKHVWMGQNLLAKNTVIDPAINRLIQSYLQQREVHDCRVAEAARNMSSSSSSSSSSLGLAPMDVSPDVVDALPDAKSPASAAPDAKSPCSSATSLPLPPPAPIERKSSSSTTTMFGLINFGGSSASSSSSSVGLQAAPAASAPAAGVFGFVQTVTNFFTTGFGSLPASAPDADMQPPSVRSPFGNS